MKSAFSRNLAASVLAQLLRYGAPLAFYPFLTRVLGAEGFATFALAFAGSVMLGQLIEFGFGLSGVRALAEASEHPTEAAEVVGDVVIGRCVTLAVVVAGSLLCWRWAPVTVRSDLPLALSVAALAIGYGFSSSWYFIGRERAAQLAGLEIVTSFLQLGLLLLLVKAESPNWLPVALMALPVWVVVAFGHVLAFRDLGAIRPSMLRLRDKLIESFQYFCFTGIMPILNRANLLVLGSMSTPSQVAFYAVGERVVTAAANATVPVIRVAMPRITNLLRDDPDAAKRIFRRSLFSLTGLAAVGAVLGAAFTPWGVPIVFGAAIAPGALVIAIQLFIVPALMATRITGTLALVPLRQEGSYQRVVLVSSVGGLCLAPLVILWGDATGLAAWRVVVELGAAGYCLWILTRRRDGWLKAFKASAHDASRNTY